MFACRGNRSIRLALRHLIYNVGFKSLIADKPFDGNY